MIRLTDLSTTSIHRRAVAIGRDRGLHEEAGRLEDSDPAKHIAELIGQFGDAVPSDLTNEHLEDILAVRLWRNWMGVEYRMATIMEQLARDPSLIQKLLKAA